MKQIEIVTKNYRYWGDQINMIPFKGKTGGHKKQAVLWHTGTLLRRLSASLQGATNFNQGNA